MDRAAFDLWVETEFAPTLRRGDIVILDNLAVHKSAKAAEVLKTKGAWFLFLPAYSPDLNLIEMAFSKLKAHLRAAGARTFDALWKAVGRICDLFNPQECWNYLVAAGYAYDALASSKIDRSTNERCLNESVQAFGSTAVSRAKNNAA